MVGRRLGTENTADEGVSNVTTSGIPAAPSHFSNVRGVIELCMSDPSRGSHARDRLRDLKIVVAAAQPLGINLEFLRDCPHSSEFPPIENLIPSEFFPQGIPQKAAKYVKMIAVEDAYKLLYPENDDGPVENNGTPHVLHIATDHKEQTDSGPGMMYLYFAPQGENLPIKIS